jgi:hypothetical protein
MELRFKVFWPANVHPPCNKLSFLECGFGASSWQVMMGFAHCRMTFLARDAVGEVPAAPRAVQLHGICRQEGDQTRSYSERYD